MIAIESSRRDPEPAIAPLTALLAEAQVVLPDALDREMLQNGELGRRIAAGGVDLDAVTDRLEKRGNATFTR